MPYRLALIGEAPGHEEETHGRPFIGSSGHLLDNLLVASDILRGATYIGNVCQIRPPGNELSRFEWEGPEIQTGLSVLRNDLQELRPNLVVLLGNSALRAAGMPDAKVSDWRGSLFLCQDPNSPFHGLKCMATYHPAAVLRQYENMPLMHFDLKRARKQAEFPELRPPLHRFELDLTADQIVERLNNWPTGHELSVDIEGGLSAISCVGISPGPNEGFIIAWSKFTVEEEMRVVSALSRVLWRTNVPKTLQNSLYDNFVKAYGYRMLIRGLRDDTMLKGHEIYPELPKGLDTQASIWTDQPQWKHLIAYSKKEQEKRRKAGVDAYTEARNKHYACCIDCSVTSWISRAQNHVLSGRRLEHYRMNVEMLQPLLYMELRGISYRAEEAKNALIETQVKIAEQQTVLNLRAKRELNISSPKQMTEFLYNVKGFEPIYKKEHGRKTDKVTADVEALLVLHKKYGDPVISDILRLRALDSRRKTLEVTTDPDGRVRCGYNIVGTDTGRLTCYASPTGSGDNLQTITETLRYLYAADEDNDFAQCDLAGADGWTVAVRCALLGDRTMLDDYLAGIKPAKVIALMHQVMQQELLTSGAKGAAEIQRVKLRVISHFVTMDRDILRTACDAVKKSDWIYFASKRVQHGTNYGMGPGTMSSQILKDSYKKEGTPIYISMSDCRTLQELYLEGRYRGVKKWHGWVAHQLLTKGKLESASGHVRTFFGRKKSQGQVDQETFKQILAHEPQNNTTYATNLAMLNLWKDPSNRLGSYFGVGSADYMDQLVRHGGREAGQHIINIMSTLPSHQHPMGRLLVEPLHQVHDALCSQSHKKLGEWRWVKTRSWFNNELDIDGFRIVIPFEGHFGPSWGEQPNNI